MKKLILALVVLGICVIACSYSTSVRGPSIPVPDPIKDELAKSVLSGMPVIIFGDGLSGLHTKLQNAGAIITPAADLSSAVDLAGEGAVEIHCIGENDTIVLQVSKADKIYFDPERTNPITPCSRGTILIGFAIEPNPNIVIP